MDELKRTRQWFEQAMPKPTVEQACIQIGCHYEEIEEMARTLQDGQLSHELVDLSHYYKNLPQDYIHALMNMPHNEKVQLLDDMIDQIVTAIGVCHTMNFDVIGALGEVNRSNFSKFENGKPVFNEQGKIAKGKNYSRPELISFIGWKKL